MAIRTDNDLPELVPFDDRLPSREGLFRRSEEMPDDQFALLAAEWAEGEADADRLSEIESMFASSPEKRLLAEDFKRIRLVHGNEKWPGMEALIKAPAQASYLKRITYAILASAAVALAFLALSPLLHNTVTPSSPAILPEAKITVAATMPAQNPVASPGRTTAGRQTAGRQTAPASEKLQADAGQNPRIQPLDFSHDPEAVRLIASAGAGSTELKPVEMMPVDSNIRSLPREANWMMRGITALSKTITGKDKPVDGYMVAGACVKGINSALGWDMDLEKVMSDDGNTLAVNFSSSLVSFSSPAKKSTYEP